VAAQSPTNSEAAQATKRGGAWAWSLEAAGRGRRPPAVQLWCLMKCACQQFHVYAVELNPDAISVVWLYVM